MLRDDGGYSGRDSGRHDEDDGYNRRGSGAGSSRGGHSYYQLNVQPPQSQLPPTSRQPLMAPAPMFYHPGMFYGMPNMGGWAPSYTPAPYARQPNMLPQSRPLLGPVDQGFTRNVRARHDFDNIALQQQIVQGPKPSSAAAGSSSSSQPSTKATAPSSAVAELFSALQTKAEIDGQILAADLAHQPITADVTAALDTVIDEIKHLRKRIENEKANRLTI